MATDNTGNYDTNFVARATYQTIERVVCFKIPRTKFVGWKYEADLCVIGDLFNWFWRQLQQFIKNLRTSQDNNDGDHMMLLLILMFWLDDVIKAPVKSRLWQVGSLTAWWHFVLNAVWTSINVKQVLRVTARRGRGQPGKIARCP